MLFQLQIDFRFPKPKKVRCWKRTKQRESCWTWMKNQFLFFFKELHKDANGRVRIVAEYMILSSRSKDSDPIEIGPVQARNSYCPSKSIHSKAQEWAQKKSNPVIYPTLSQTQWSAPSVRKKPAGRGPVEEKEKKTRLMVYIKTRRWYFFTGKKNSYSNQISPPSPLSQRPQASQHASSRSRTQRRVLNNPLRHRFS